jgi:UDP-N-acetylmuramyl pentapeptide phosphotransferase/UDP-N-acetylglucosamine-1-phosphate transferase
MSNPELKRTAGPAATCVIIPARNEAARVGETVRSAKSLPGVRRVIVVDDASRDDTAAAAQQAGGSVLRLSRRAGKGFALSTGLRRCAELEGGSLEHLRLLFLDADVGSSAAGAKPLLEAAASGKVEMAIGVLPRGAGGGFGLVMRLARLGIKLLTWRTMKAPLSGQRVISGRLARKVRLAPGFGVEAALTVDALALQAKVVEIGVDMTHAPLGKTVPGFAHRALQGFDLVMALLPRLLWPVSPTGRLAPRSRLAAWILFWAVAAGLSSLGPSSLRLAAVLLMWAFLSLVLALWICEKPRLLRQNYLGRTVPCGVGVAFPLFLSAATILMWATAIRPMGREQWAALLLSWALCGVGLTDDVFGSRDVTGLRGHLGSLLRLIFRKPGGRVTTGAAKAIVGAGACFVVGLWLNRPVPSPVEGWTAWPGLLDGMLLALGANAINLLDVRPGRALKVFLALAAISCALDPSTLDFLGPLALATLVYWPLDLSGRALMGDAGSNPLGAAAALGLCLTLPVWGRAAVVIAMAALHLYCEKWSLTDLIQRLKPLRWLDMLGRPAEFE